MLEGCVPWPDEFVKLYKEKGYWEDIPFSDHIDEWVTNYADRPAIACDGQEVTYRQMDVYVTRLAYHLTKMGLKTYDRVVVQLMNGPELIYLVYACFKIGAILLYKANVLKGNKTFAGHTDMFVSGLATDRIHHRQDRDHQYTSEP